MFKRLGQVALIFAVLAATGTHWAVLQSVAWTTMLANNLGTKSLQVAVGETFDGKHPCSLCKQISKGKQSEKKSPSRLEWQKLEFSYTAQTHIFTPPTDYRELPALDNRAPQLNIAPPTPPPRLA